MLELGFPPNYPHSPPKARAKPTACACAYAYPLRLTLTLQVRFATRIFHPNVQWGSGKGEGSVCIDVLHSGLWRPECTVRPSTRISPLYLPYIGPLAPRVHGAP